VQSCSLNISRPIHGNPYLFLRFTLTIYQSYRNTHFHSFNYEAVISKMFNTIIIRLAEPEDAATIAYFSRKTFFESFAEKNSKRDMEKFLKLQFSVNNLMGEVGRNHNTILLAYRYHTLVGYALMRECKNPPEINQAVKGMELVRMYVDKRFQRTGVGNALMKECISRARLMDKEILWLGVWHENHPAIDFYSSWGFSKCGSKIFILGDDPQIHWLMKKDLQS
jgi:diamine N-acetyltransferase